MPSLWKDRMSMSKLRLLSFCLFSSCSSPTCAKMGGCHPNALYKARCSGVDEIHSYKFGFSLVLDPYCSTYSTTNHMRYLHVMIIHDVRKMISRKAIGFHQYWVIIDLVALMIWSSYLTIDQVSIYGVSFIESSEPDYVWFSCRSTTI